MSFLDYTTIVGVVGRNKGLFSRLQYPPVTNKKVSFELEEPVVSRLDCSQLCNQRYNCLFSIEKKTCSIWATAFYGALGFQL
ncbi:hypothetical protein HI914_04771 [Erysiphe necator]|nr:hypothetical protein HI914_04771 [Erysiphe necator]